MTVTASARPTWYPGSTPPKYLDGSMGGDYGFDPLRLGSDPEWLKWFAHAEVFHGRLAMTAVAGILVPAISTAAGISGVPQWYDAPKAVAGATSAYPAAANVFVTLLLAGWVENKRWADIENPGSQGDGSFLGVTDALKGTEPGYPGGPWFDPMGLSRGDKAKYEEYKVKEIKNGRLAMVAFAGFEAQHRATGAGPIENLVEHIKTGASFATNGVSLPLLHN